MEERNHFFKPAQQIELMFRLDHSKAAWSSGMAMEGDDLWNHTWNLQSRYPTLCSHCNTNSKPTSKNHCNPKPCPQETILSPWNSIPLSPGGWVLLPGLGIFPLADPTSCKVPKQQASRRAWAEAAFCPVAGAEPAHTGIQNSQSHKEKALEGKYDSMRKRFPGEGAEPHTLVPSPEIAHAYCTEDYIKCIHSSLYTKASKIHPMSCINKPKSQWELCPNRRTTYSYLYSWKYFYTWWIKVNQRANLRSSQVWLTSANFMFWQ